MSDYSLDKLNQFHQRGENVDKRLFSEQRTNIQLRLGNHYSKQRNRAYEDLRSRGLISKDQKIRLTKNHIHRVCGLYENSILESDPTVMATPYNEDELQDVKSAEFANAVIDWVKYDNKWDGCRREKNVNDFITIGEVGAKIRFEPATGKSPARYVLDRLFGFDLKRDPNARSIDECRWWIHEQMVESEELKQLIKTLNPSIPPEKITDTLESTMRIFDTNLGEHRDAKGQALVKEYFEKPNPLRPNGWYAMYTKDFVIIQSELPNGIYPLVIGGFDEMTTSARSSSIIRVCRPYQVEINRSASKMAEHQITLGDDRVYIQSGTKISSGGKLHGVRAIQVSGKEPVIQAGRSGAQYLEYQLSQVKEMYEACNLEFVVQEKQQQGDPWQSLFKAMKDKRRFIKYVDKYQRWEIEVFKTVLKMAKKDLDDSTIIRIAGRSEAVNIPEFKRMSDDGFQIKVVPQSGDVETQYGKILSAINVLQYTSGQLEPEQIGAIVRELPLGNSENILSDLTIDSDNATNDILALDRGEVVPVNIQDNHKFLLKKLINRTKKSDFRFLPEQIQLNYQQKIALHQEYIADAIERERRAQMGMIPTSGYLITVNASMPDPVTGKVQRVKLPSDTLAWVLSKLQDQGMMLQNLDDLPEEQRLRIMEQAQAQAQVNTQPKAV